MIVQALADTDKDLPDELREYALTQDDDGNIDLTKDKHYAVYAMKREDDQDWYFVHTDERNPDSLWWMPAQLYKVVDETMASGWITKPYSDDIQTIHSGYLSLFNWKVEEGIIDNEAWAIDEYMAEVSADPTFPTLGELETWNHELLKRQKHQKNMQDIKNMRERGWEMPEYNE